MWCALLKKGTPVGYIINKMDLSRSQALIKTTVMLTPSAPRQNRRSLPTVPCPALPCLTCLPFLDTTAMR